MLTSCMFVAVLFAFTAIAAGDPRLVIYPAGDSHTKEVGGQIVFTCTVTGLSNNDYDPNLQWRDKNGQTITDTTGRMYIELDTLQTLKLYITPIESDDAGDYECEGSVEGVVLTETTKLTVFRDITFDHAPSPQHPKINENALIECRVSGEPTPDVSWRYRNTKIVTGGRYVLENDGLRVRNITEEDNGIYICRAEIVATGNLDQRELDVIVHIPPQIVEPPGQEEGIQGHEASVTCKASGKPAPKYEFYKDNNGAPVAPNERIELDSEGGAIHFRPLKKEDEGDYRCNAFNDAGEDSGTGHLFVVVPPTVTRLINVTAEEGKEVTLTCEVDADPPPKMTFRKEENSYDYEDGENDGGRIIVTSTPNKLELKISNLQPEDTSNYTCKAINTGGQVEKNGTITVEFSPRFASDHVREHMAWAGKTRNMSCHSLGQPEPSIHWYRDDKVIADNETYKNYDMGRNHVLQVTVREEYQGWVYGDYECRATNTHGIESLTIKLERATVPDQPESVSVRESSPTMAVFTVVPPADDGGVEILGYKVEYESKARSFRLDEEIRIENLKPSTQYLFQFRAQNEVGPGNALSYSHKTDDIREPFPIVVVSDPVGKYPYHYNAQWEKPKTGGKDILEYEFRFVRVRVDDSNNIIDTLGKWERRTAIDDPDRPMLTYELQNLKPQSHYQLEIRARNDIGWSDPSEEFVFSTDKDSKVNPTVVIYKSMTTVSKAGNADPERPTPAPPISVQEPTGTEDSGEAVAPARKKTGMGTGAVIGIIIAVFFIFLIIVDISCYFMNSCGILMFICVHLCGKEQPGSKEKSMEEGESKAMVKQQEDPVEEAKIAPEEGEEPPTAEQPVDDQEDEKKPLSEVGQDSPSAEHEEEHLNKPEEDEESKEALKEEIKAEETDEKQPLTESTKDEIAEEKEAAKAAEEAKPKTIEDTPEQPAAEQPAKA